MSESNSVDLPTVESSPKKEISKQSFRRIVWEHLERNNLSNFPRPVYGRIPNFKGTEQAAAKLLDLEEFQIAKNIEVNPDKPLESSRVVVLENGKNLYVPVPRLKESLLKQLFKHSDQTINIKKLVSRWGIEHLGETIDLEDDICIDVLVLGSVAVSKSGHRIGKGKGYADLEFAILKDMKAVNDDTVIITTVHDSQVFDELPEELFKEYDVPVDYILTPTQIIKVEKRLPRPKGIIWSLLSQRRVNLMQILQKLKKKHESDGKETTLKDVDSDVENIPPRRFVRFSRRRRSANRNDEAETENASSMERKSQPQFQRRRRYFRRSKVIKQEEETRATVHEAKDPENGAKAVPSRRKKFRKPHRRDFSLVVKNIEKDVRVRDLKIALADKGIKPDDITWRGYKGFCYLHYDKPNNKKNAGDTEEKKPFSVDSVIEIIEKLKITPDSTANLTASVMEPITRIETTDVTAV